MKLEEQTRNMRENKKKTGGRVYKLEEEIRKMRERKKKTRGGYIKATNLSPTTDTRFPNILKNLKSMSDNIDSGFENI